MLSEQGMTYALTFKRSQRHEAARLAYDLARHQGVGHKKALLASGKAFLGRKVTVSASTITAPECSRFREEIESLNRKRIINRVVTHSGFDPRRVRGDSQPMARKAVIRTWPFKGNSHPGHAALSLKEASTDSKAKTHTYLSWWPTYKYESLREKIIEKLGLDSLVYQKAKMERSYKVDKYNELSRRAEELLKAGKTPRPRQIFTQSKKQWGVQADKVYVPFSGPNRNTVTGEEVFHLFGLDQQKMESYTQYLKESAESGQEKYGFLSANNCSEIVLKALRKGGANAYTNTNDAWLVTDPNNVHRTATRLQERVDELNDKAFYLLDRFESDELRSQTIFRAGKHPSKPSEPEQNVGCQRLL